MQIMNKYQIVMTLMKQIDFHSKLAEMKFGPNKPEMTWIELMIEFLRNFNDDVILGERCSYILMMCALQIREIHS